jgi:hypothetical protein
MTPSAERRDRQVAVARQISVLKRWFNKETLTRTLVGLGEDREVEDFVAYIPGFLDSHIAPAAAATMLDLMNTSMTRSFPCGFTTPGRPAFPLHPV